MKKARFYKFFLFLCLAALVFCFSSCASYEKRETESFSENEETQEATLDLVSEEMTSDSVTEEENLPKKRVAFTFDDGPHPVYTKRIVDCVQSYGGRVTFFAVGNMLDRSQSHAEALVYAADADCEIGLHSYTHLNNYDECDEETFLSELSKTVDAIRTYIPDFEASIMRPVGGRISEAFVKSCPYAVVKWNVDTRDWERYGADGKEQKEANISAIVDEILKSTKDGSIVLMHDLYENTAVAFERAAKILADEGYEFVTVSEILGEDLEAGKVFSKGKPITAAQASHSK